MNTLATEAAAPIRWVVEPGKPATAAVPGSDLGEACAWLREHLQALEAAGRRVSRVVPGTSVTMARSEASSALKREDFPAVGFPTSTARTPWRSSRPRGAVTRRDSMSLSSASIPPRS